MNSLLRDPSCLGCQTVTSGDCGRHGPAVFVTTSVSASARSGPASGEPVDGFFNIRKTATGLIAFNVRLGNGAPFTVYLRPHKAYELAHLLLSLASPEEPARDP